MNDVNTHELHQFFAGYFHEDWSLDDKEPEDVIALFVSSVVHEPGKAARLASLIDDYVSRTPENMLDQALFRELGCYYLPSASGLSASRWLRSVATQLRASAARPT
jgi:hypothetical protein